MRHSKPAAVSAAIATAAALVLAGCGSVPDHSHNSPLAQGTVVRGTAAVEPHVSPAPYGNADLRFGLDLLNAWCAEDPSANVVFSPSSLATGLGMAYLGARGATAQAMAAVLHLPAGAGASLEAGLQARARALRQLDGPGVTVSDSDEVWADPSLTPLRSYLNAVATAYQAGVGRVPLLTAPAEAAAEIDAAVAAGTRGHIRHLLSAADVSGSIFVLTDALYLDAKWQTPFVPQEGFAGPFTTAAGRRVQAWYLSGQVFSSAQAQGWTAVSLPYRGGRLAMTALLPPAGRQGTRCPVPTAGVTEALERQLAHDPGSAMLDLPQVNLSTDEHLTGLLSSLGMGIAFSQQADFTGMSPMAGSLGTVVHAATLRVNAVGTVGTAATGVTVLPTSERVGLVVNLDRPYLMLITDVRTGEPLFVARVANPDLP